MGKTIFRSMQGKIFMAILVIVAITMTLSTFFFYQRSANTIEKNYGENLYARLCQIGDSFDDSIENIYYLVTQESCDEELVQAIEDYKEEPLTTDTMDHLAQLLQNLSGRSSDFGSVYLLIPERREIITSNDYPVCVKEVEDKTIDQIAVLSKKSMSSQMIQNPIRSTSSILTIVNQVVDNDGQVIGYLMGNVTERSIFYKYLDTLEQSENLKAVIIDSEDTIVSVKNQSKVGLEYKDKKIDDISSEGIQISNDRKIMHIAYQTKFTGVIFAVDTEMNQILSELRSTLYYLIGIFILSIILSSVLAVFITRAVNKPLRNLTRTMSEISDGNLEQRVVITSQDEIGILSEDFNQMLDHIEELIQQVVQEEMLKKNAELEALQYQITPHFMYNTLNSIKYAALLKGEQEIGSYIDDFVELLQASISKKGTFVMVAEEIHFVNNYIHLQNMRYEEDIEVIYHIAPEIEGYYLPRLMLQPLVENAILHGLDLKNGKNHIIISAEVMDETLIISVKDEGRGMSQEKINEILHKKEKKTRGMSGIGVANVQERLKLYYGEKAGLQYRSSEEGTTVSIYLPAYREQNQYAL